MKKLLGAVLSLALLIPSGSVSAELLKNLKVDGKIDVQAVSANNISDFNTAAYDRIGDAQTRVMVNLGWDLLDDVHSMVTLRKNNRTYGTGSESLQTATQTAVFLDQAYFKVDKVFGAIDTTLGRQFYGEQGDAVIYFGPHDNLYGLAVSALDTARFDWNGNWVGVTGLVGKVTGAAQAAGNEAANVDLRGLRAMFKGNDMWNGAAYLYNAVTHNTGAAGSFGGAGNAPPSNKDDYLYVIGVKGKVMMGGGWLRGEFDKNFGQNRPAAAGITGGAYTGWEMLADAGYKLNVADISSFTPWAQIGVGSGGTTGNQDFAPIASDYRPGGIYGLFAPASTGASAVTPATLGATSGLGTVSSNTLSDRVIWGLGVKATPAGLPKLTTGLAWYDYRYQQLGGNTANGTPAAAKGNKHIGSEVDLNASWAHSDNVSFGVGIGTFQTGGAIENSQKAANPAFLADATCSVKF